jgi:hypothetical protein
MRKGKGEFRKHFAVAPKADRTDIDGVTHDSKSEMVRWKSLQILERTGSIRKLERQVPYPMVVNGVEIRRPWKCDFRYEEFKDGAWRLVVEDLGEIEARHSRMTRKLMKALHNIDVLCTRAYSR